MTWLVSCACVFLGSVFWLFSWILTCCWLRAMDLFYHVFVVAWIVGLISCLVYVMDCLSWFLGCHVVACIVICCLMCVMDCDLLLGVRHGLFIMVSWLPGCYMDCDLSLGVCVSWIVYHVFSVAVLRVDWFSCFLAVLLHGLWCCLIDLCRGLFIMVTLSRMDCEVMSWIVHLSCFAWILWRLLWHMDCVWHFRCCVCCRDWERFAWCLAWVVYQVYHDFLGVLLHGLWFDSLM